MKLSGIDATLCARVAADVLPAPFDRTIVNTESFDEGRCVLPAALAT
jgi:hypothetical protein